MIWLSINFDKLIEMSLPTFLRQPVLLSLLSTITQPLKVLYQEIVYKMQHTCQVIYLEKMLNEYFEVVGYNNQNHETTKAIYITDYPKPPTQYVYLEQEIPPNNYLYLGVKYLNGNEVHYDFIVHIPFVYSFEEVKIRAIIDYYKLAGKNYKIEIV